MLLLLLPPREEGGSGRSIQFSWPLCCSIISVIWCCFGAHCYCENSRGLRWLERTKKNSTGGLSGASVDKSESGRDRVAL